MYCMDYGTEPTCFRDISAIKEDLEEARRNLYRSHSALDLAEEVATRLSNTLEHGDGEESYLSLLDAVCETGEELQREVGDLKLRIDSLSEELDETLFWFRGSASC